MSDIKSKGGATIEEGDTVSTPVSSNAGPEAFQKMQSRMLTMDSIAVESMKAR